MADLESKVLQAATGEKRLNPDEQRLYFGTFAERVVLSIPLEDSRLEDVQKRFSDILKELNGKYDTLSVKISPKLSVSNQVFYMKIAQELGNQATIVDEKMHNHHMVSSYTLIRLKMSITLCCLNNFRHSKETKEAPC